MCADLLILSSDWVLGCGFLVDREGRLLGREPAYSKEGEFSKVFIKDSFSQKCAALPASKP